MFTSLNIFECVGANSFARSTEGLESGHENGNRRIDEITNHNFTRNSSNADESDESKLVEAMGSTMTPALKRPRPKTTAAWISGSRVMMFSVVRLE